MKKQFAISSIVAIAIAAVLALLSTLAMSCAPSDSLFGHIYARQAGIVPHYVTREAAEKHTVIAGTSSETDVIQIVTKTKIAKNGDELRLDEEASDVIELSNGRTLKNGDILRCMTRFRYTGEGPCADIMFHEGLGNGLEYIPGSLQIYVGDDFDVNLVGGVNEVSLCEDPNEIAILCGRRLPDVDTYITFLVKVNTKNIEIGSHLVEITASTLVTSSASTTSTKDQNTSSETDDSLLSALSSDSGRYVADKNVVIVDHSSFWLAVYNSFPFWGILAIFLILPIQRTASERQI